MELGEARIRKWNRRHDVLIGVVYVPVGLAGCNGIIRFTVVEQDVAPLLPVGIMRTLQARLDLTDDDGDKVIFRQFGGESSLCQNNVEGCATNYTSVTCTIDPDAWTTIHQRETMTQHPHAVADHGRRQHLTTTVHARSHPTNFPTSSPRFKSGQQMHDALQHHMRDFWTSSRGDQSWGDSTAWWTLWTTKQWKRLAHCMLYVRCAAFFDTLSREFLMLIPMGRSEDIRLALRRREQRQMNKRRAMLRTFWRLSGCKAKPHREATGNPVEDGAERLRSSADCDPEGRQRCECTSNDARCAGIGGSALP